MYETRVREMMTPRNTYRQLGRNPRRGWGLESHRNFVWQQFASSTTEIRVLPLQLLPNLCNRRYLLSYFQVVNTQAGPFAEKRGPKPGMQKWRGWGWNSAYQM
jgi:hypothetical protein